jgi:hypothetical protein
MTSDQVGHRSELKQRMCGSVLSVEFRGAPKFSRNDDCSNVCAADRSTKDCGVSATMRKG